MLAVVDIVIVVIYMIIVIIIGIIASRKSEGDTLNSYFLGDNKIPFWALAASGISSNIDVSGTAINSALIYSLGLNGFYIEFRGGVTLSLALFMILSKWTRRTKVMTLSELYSMRFGEGWQGKLSRIITAFSSIIGTIFSITYFSIGSGLFVQHFLNLPEKVLGVSSLFWCSLIITVTTLIYTVTSGLQGVVWTDVFQGFTIFIICVAFMIYTLVKITIPNEFFTSTPLKSGNFSQVAHTWGEFTSLIPRMKIPDFPKDSTYYNYSFIFPVSSFYLMKTILEGLGGPKGYFLQRYNSTSSEKESAKMSVMWILLLSLRWPITVIFVLSGIYYGTQNTVIENPEKVLFYVVDSLPTVFKGFVFSILIGAASSTFDSTLNAGTAYFSEDIYHTFLDKNASQKKLVFVSKIASVVITILGVLPCLFVTNINLVWDFLNMSLGLGVFAPMVAQWFWWRVNGMSYSLSTLMGIIGSIIKFTALKNINEYYSFLFIIGCSILGMLIGIIAAPPTDMKSLKRFYCIVRPPLFWSKVTEEMNIDQNTKKLIRNEHIRDILNAIFIAVPMQVSLFCFLMSLVVGRFLQFSIFFVIFASTAVWLYFFWWRYLDKEITIDYQEEQNDENKLLEKEISDVDIFDKNK